MNNTKDRSPDNDTLTISLPKEMKDRIKAVAGQNFTNSSQWVRAQLADILADLEARQQTHHAPLESVESTTPVPAKRRSAR